MNIRLIDFRPPRIAQLLLLVAFLLHWLTALGQQHVFANLPLGATLGITGFGVMMWAWWLFKRSDTAVCPTASNQCLVTGSIYRITRNPMYLGMAVMLLGLAILVGTIPFYVVAAAFFVIMDRVFCPYEENKLRETFGGVYLDYQQHVRRWI